MASAAAVGGKPREIQKKTKQCYSCQLEQRAHAGEGCHSDWVAPGAVVGPSCGRVVVVGGCSASLWGALHGWEGSTVS